MTQQGSTRMNKERRRGGDDFEAILNAYLTIAPKGFDKINHSRGKVQHADTWGEIVSPGWLQGEDKIFYMFQVQHNFGNHIGVELHDERMPRRHDNIASQLQTLSSEITQYFPGNRVELADFQYTGYGISVLYDRKPNGTADYFMEIAKGMRTLINHTHQKLKIGERNRDLRQ